VLGGLFDMPRLSVCIVGEARDFVPDIGGPFARVGELVQEVADDLVRSNCAARYDEWIAYVGNGTGLTTYQVGDGPVSGVKHPNLATSLFKPLEEAIDIAISATNPPSTLNRRHKITNLLLDNVVILPTKTTPLLSAVFRRKPTYRYGWD
jgi:hypothetical protein